jgi:hypothetical protein
MFVQPFSFISYYFYELNLMISFFISKRHLTASWRRDMGMILRPIRIDPDLWMEARSSNGLNRNQVYRLSNTTTENLGTNRSVSTVRSSQSIQGTQSLEFSTLQEHATHLNEKYEWLCTKYKELHRMVMDIRS